MQKSRFLLLASAVIVGLVVFAPAPAQAIDWCTPCENSGYTDCYSCCRCDGGGGPFCAILCGSPDSKVGIVPAPQFNANGCGAAKTSSTVETPAPVEAPAAVVAPAAVETPDAVEAPATEKVPATDASN